MDVDLPNILKRCLSAPVINNSTTSTVVTSATRPAEEEMTSTSPQTATTPSREPSPAPVLNIFAPRARRYSASYASLGANAGNGPRLTPRVSQLRQEECADMNSREVNHEREVHSAMQISQSWEDLTLVAENWSCKSDDVTNPLHVTLPTGTTSCSSPSPTNRTGMRLPYGLSPSPTRRTFATRRSMSPIAMRPSQLGPVKRKFELEDNAWNTYSPPPLKKIFTESRGPSPVCQSPSSICPSPDSGTYEGRTTPKLFVSKLFTINTNSSSSHCSSPISASPMNELPLDLQRTSASPANTVSSSSNEPISVASCYEDLDNDNGSNDTNMEMKDKMTDEDMTVSTTTCETGESSLNLSRKQAKQQSNINILCKSSVDDMTDNSVTFKINTLKDDDSSSDNSIKKDEGVADVDIETDNTEEFIVSQRESDLTNKSIESSVCHGSLINVERRKNM